MPQSVDDAPTLLLGIWYISHYTGYATNKLRVTPCVKSERKQWLVFSIDVGITQLFILHQRQATAKGIHFFVLRFYDHTPRLVFCAIQSILLKDDIILVHTITVLSSAKVQQLLQTPSISVGEIRKPAISLPLFLSNFTMPQYLVHKDSGAQSLFRHSNRR